MDVVSEVEKVSTLTKWTLFSGQLTSYSETSHLSPEHVVGLAEQVANIVAQKRSTRLEELEHPTGGAGALDWRSWSTRLEELEHSTGGAGAGRCQAHQQTPVTGGEGGFVGVSD